MAIANTAQHLNKKFVVFIFLFVLIVKPVNYILSLFFYLSYLLFLSAFICYAARLRVAAPAGGGRDVARRVSTNALQPAELPK
jgi:hypothetical protein